MKGERFELRLGEKGYPSQLAESMDAPAVLYGRGSASALEPGLAIVGARRATPYGLGCTRLFAGRAAASGVTVISGGAIGCDQAAARAALEEGGRTVAVMGCGADVVYPRDADALFDQIVDAGGCVVSEIPWGISPRKGMFVRRNRIIAGLARATLIVEAGLPSGTFSTADAALEAGREVLVVPGSIISPESHGSNRLLMQGAYPIIDLETFDAVLASLFPILRSEEICQEDGEEARLSQEQKVLLRMLAAAPMHAERVSREMQLDASHTVLLLAESEAAGLVVRYRDGRYGVPVRKKVGDSGSGVARGVV